MAFLNVAMLSLLIMFFALFAGLVRFSEHVIRPRREAVLPSDDGRPERPVSQVAAS